MAKIKRKKKMTLLELVEWAWNNPEQVESKVFQSDRMGTLGECSESTFFN
ncbi:phage protein [Staphylococcus aureus]|nr:phage protein [Staphylococcus aureus]